MSNTHQDGISRRTFLTAAPLALASLAGITLTAGCSEETKDTDVMLDNTQVNNIVENTDPVYAVLYLDNTLVFQQGDTPDTDTYGQMRQVYSGFDAIDDDNWYYGFPETIERVIFTCRVKPISTAVWFLDCTKLTSVEHAELLDTSMVTDMTDMFCGCSSLISIDVSSWDTSNVTYMNGMFAGCSSLTSLDAANWNTNKVTSMASMFRGCSSLESLFATNWLNPIVTTMSSMFYNCSSLISLSIDNWENGFVANISNMFQGCSSLAELDLSGWNTQSVTDMSYMFKDCSSLVSLNLSTWDTSRQPYTYHMYEGCTSLVNVETTDPLLMLTTNNTNYDEVEKVEENNLNEGIEDAKPLY